MGQTGTFWNDLEKSFGKGTLTSGYRSQREQDDLVARGKTRAKRSAHTYNEGYDFKGNFARNEEEFRNKLRAQGWEVDKVLYETGKGRNQGTGPHWHTEGMRRVGSGPKTQNGAPVNTAEPGQGIVNPQAYLSALGSKLAPEGKASGKVTQNAQAIFGSDAEMRKRGQAVESSMDLQGPAIDVLTQVTEAAQLQQVKSMESQLQDTRAISGEIVNATQELKNQVKPVFEARQRVANQLDQLATMNPIERGLRGVFDLNYDRKYLTQQLDQFDRTLKMRADDYDYVNNLHAVAMQEIDRRYKMDNAMPGLIVDQAKEDLGLVGLRIQHAAGKLGNLRDMIQGESQLIAAKAAAREDLLNRLDNPTVLDLATQARNNGGVIQFNGAEFSYGELRDRVEANERQNLMLRGAQIAAAQGEMNLAESYATQLARSLTKPQLEAAMAAGGVWNGVQLPQDVLTQSYAGMQQRETMRAEEIANTLPAKSALTVGSDSLNAMTGLFNRASSMFGTGDFQAVTPMMTRGTELVRQLIDATERGESPQVITALTAQIAANTKAFSDQVDASILRSVGGDKRAAGYVKAFTYGTPINGGVASEALTYFAIKGNLPQGMAISEEARSLFKRAQSLVAANRTDDKGKLRPESELLRIVNDELGNVAASTIGAARFNRIYQDLPNAARTMQHPLGRLDSIEWRDAVATAQQDSVSAFAKSFRPVINGQEISVTEEQIRLMMAGKKIDSTPESGEIYKQFNANAGKLRLLEFQILSDTIDQLPQVQPGAANSSVVLDFLRNGKGTKVAETYSKVLGTQSMGDYLANGLASGATETVMQTYGSEMDSARRTAMASRRRQARERANQWGANPAARYAAIMAGIEGIGPHGAKAMMPIIREFTAKQQTPEGFRNSYSASDGIAMNNLMVQQEREFVRFLQTQKFEDPALEAYRRNAVKYWDATGTKLDSGMDTFWKIITGAEW